MKIGLASFLSCLALVLGLYTTTGTASAHSAIHPFINVVSGLQRSGNCVSFQLEGGDFTPNHHVDLFANGGGSIDPGRVRADGDGRFLVDATACQNFNEFSNCGSFIESTNFCGFNLPQNDFCGNGFSCPFIGSAMKPLPGPCMQPWWCQQGQGQGQGQWGQQEGQGQGQGQWGQQGGQCQKWNQNCQQGPGGNRQQHPHFHPVRVFDFCRSHEHGLSPFPFCFRFFRQQFPIQIVITAVDEHTGRHAHVGIGIGGSF